MRSFIIAIVIAAVLLPGAVLAADWPQFRGPSYDGVSPEKGISKVWNQKPPKMVWTVPMTDDGYAGPCVAGGKVFIIDHKDKQDIVKAVDFKTGKEMWRYPYADAEDANYGFSRATPAVSGGRVYALGRMGLLNCLNAKTGKLIWSRNIFTEFKGKKPQWNYSMSPFIDGNKVIVVPGGRNAAVVALDKTTGKTIWQGGGSDIPGYVTPIAATIEGKRQYVVFMGVSLIGVDPATGALLWRLPRKAFADINGAQPYVIGNTIFISTGYGEGGDAMVEIQNGAAKIKWESKELRSRFSSPVYLGGFIYCVGEPGNLTCIDPNDGAVKWKQKGFEFGGLVAVDGVIMVADGRGGDLAMVKPSPDSYQEIGRFKPLGGQSWTAPIVSGGKLIVRNKSALACFDLK